MAVAAVPSRMFDEAERAYLERARVGRLATADAAGRPHAVPVCFALASGDVVTAVDEKPQSVDPTELRRVRDVRENDRVALVVDHYREDWRALGWVQVRGTATVRQPGDSGHRRGVTRLRRKYTQYESHDLGERPLLAISPGQVRSWGDLSGDT